jgi:hypothetical protein
MISPTTKNQGYSKKRNYSILSITYFVPLISKENPTLFPINLFPNGDCGESAITFVPSIAILGSAAHK